MEAPDEQLMLAYRDGNAGAFETLYARHRSRLYRFLLRSVKSKAVGEELFQEIWMRVIESRGRYGVSSRAEMEPGAPVVAEDVQAASERFELTRAELLAIIDEALRARGVLA